MLKQAIEAEKSAVAAWRSENAKAAGKAHEQARKAAGSLSALAKKQPENDGLRASLTKANAAELSARHHAERADEERQRREKLKGLKVRTYQKTRAAMLGAVLPRLAQAADDVAQHGTNVSLLDQQAAERALQLVQFVSGKSASASEPPDWRGTAGTLREWTTNQPIEFRAFLGLAYATLKQTDLALAEFESVDPAQLKSTNALQIYYGGRALLYAMQGWNHLAAPEAESFGKYSIQADELGGQQLVACIHGFLALDAAQKHEFVKMDAEIAQSFRAWPDNPVAVYLTGEKLAANGEWEKAAESLEKQAAGGEDEWLVRRFAQRAREFRDGKGSTKGLVFDARFLLQVVAHMAIRTAKDPGVRQRGDEFVAGAGAFGRDLLRKVAFVGGDSAAQSQSDSETNTTETGAK